MTSKLITIERHISEQQALFPQATGTFTRLLQDIALAAKIISRETVRAGLVNILGATDSENVFGERQQKLDMFANDTIYRVTDHTGRLAGIVSEENEDIQYIPEEYPTGSYILVHDPLDGSSNIDVNASIGTIFAIHRKFTKGVHATHDDVLQEGKRLVAAGYVIYGSSTMMVYTAGQGVYGFTLDPQLGEFILSHDKMQFPEEPAYFSINHGNEKYWTEGVRRYVKRAQGLDEEDRKPLKSRYIGSMVSDFHRNLLKGGIFMYPGDIREDRLNGKIRLMHEAQALSFVAEQAGGYASDGIGDVSEIRPHHIHQTVPFFVGNTSAVKELEQLIEQHDQDWLEKYKPYRNKAILEES